MSTAYAYIDRDLFESPEYYHYAPCAEPDFLEAWRAARDRILARCSSPDMTSALPPISALSPEVAMSDSVARKLAHAIAVLQLDDPDFIAVDLVLSPLIRKFEVARRIFRRYDADWKRLHNEPLAHVGTYLLLALALALRVRGQELPNLQNLSTLLKLCDALSSTSAALSEEQVRALCVTLKMERAMVAGLVR